MISGNWFISKISSWHLFCWRVVNIAPTTTPWNIHTVMFTFSLVVICTIRIHPETIRCSTYIIHSSIIYGRCTGNKNRFNSKTAIILQFKKEILGWNLILSLLCFNFIWWFWKPKLLQGSYKWLLSRHDINVKMITHLIIRHAVAHYISVPRWWGLLFHYETLMV